MATSARGRAATRPKEGGEKPGTTSAREEELTGRHRELIDVAARVFHAKGYDGSTIQDIADELGILKGSVYYYVKSKDDLLFSVINRVHEAALENVSDFPHDDLPPLEDIRQFVERHVLHSVDDIIGATVFFRDFRSLTRERRRTVLADRESYTNVLVNLINRAIDEGYGRTDLDVRTIYLAILGMTNWVYQWYRPNGGIAVEDLARNFAQLSVELVAGPSHSGP
jgi:TetR/AcrR family transcriptional regulator, cholesterol catabolism regulator